MTTPRVVPLTREQRDLVESVIPNVQALVHSLARRYPPHMNREDMLQATFEAVCKAARKFDADRGVAFSSYALRRAHGAVIDWLREEQPGTRTTPQPWPVSLDTPTYIGHDGDNSAIGDTSTIADTLACYDPDLADRDEARRVLRSISKLPEAEARTVRLFAGGTMTLEQIGKLEGVGAPAISYRMRRARARLLRLADQDPS